MTNNSQIKELINSNSKSFQALLPENLNVEKFMSCLHRAVQDNPDLGKCDNLIDIARDVATFGLLPHTAGAQAHIIPYKKTAKLIIGYRGYIAKLDEAGYFVECELVTKEEVNQGCFKEIRGSETNIIHEPIRRGIRDKENIELAYCIIKKENSDKKFISVLTKEEIIEIGKTEKWCYESKQRLRRLSKIWENDDRVTDFGQMCLKTVIRNCVKKVNLPILNEMSNYEGKQSEAINSEEKSKEQEVTKCDHLPDYEPKIKEAEIVAVEETKYNTEVFTILDDYKMRIQRATSIDLLEAIGYDIKSNVVHKKDKSVLGKIYKEKLEKLKLEKVKK